jgi:hypothetical protein
LTEDANISIATELVDVTDWSFIVTNWVSPKLYRFDCVLTVLQKYSGRGKSLIVSEVEIASDKKQMKKEKGPSI